MLRTQLGRLRFAYASKCLSHARLRYQTDPSLFWMPGNHGEGSERSKPLISDGNPVPEPMDSSLVLYQNDIMRLIGQDVLSKAVRKHADMKKWIDSWVATVEDAAWHNLADVRDDYPSADGVKLKSTIVVTVFNVKGNEYRLLTRIDYQGHAVFVLELLTHAEYQKDKWKGRY